MRKKIGGQFLTVLAGLMLLTVLPFPAIAAMPEKISYQGNLTSSAGAPVTGSVQMVFSIYTVDTGGTALWTETQTVSATNGAYSVVLGSVTPFNENLKFDAQYYLGVKVGTDAEMTPRRALTSTGYSMRAKVADSTPPGMVVAFAGATAPSGWLLCDGSAVSRTTYADLFATIGSIYGVGDGSTTFNIPDYRGQFLRGVNGSSFLGVMNDADKRFNSDGSQGDSVGSIQYWATYGRPDPHYWIGLSSVYYYPYSYSDFIQQDTIYSIAQETRPTNIAVNWIIKY